jgi:hypothetical protein
LLGSVRWLRAAAMLAACAAHGCTVLPESLLVVRIEHPPVNSATTTPYRFAVEVTRADRDELVLASGVFTPAVNVNQHCIAVRLRNAPTSPTAFRVRVRGGQLISGVARYLVVKIRDVSIARGERKEVRARFGGACQPDGRPPEFADAGASRERIAALARTGCFAVDAGQGCGADSGLESCVCVGEGSSGIAVCARADRSCETDDQATEIRCVSPEAVNNASFTSNVALPVDPTTGCLTMTM